MPRLRALLLATVMVLLAACAESAGDPAADHPVADDPPSEASPDRDPEAEDGQEQDPETSDAEATEPDQDVADAPTTDERFAFTADTLDGGQVVGSELVGRDLALWFWAPW